MGWVKLQAVLAVLGLLLSAHAPASAPRGPAGHELGFGAPVYVDQNLAGGEPSIFYDAVHHDLIYAAHEGTTHLYRGGLEGAPVGDAEFAANYRNQTIDWTSDDHGKTWQQVSIAGSGFASAPAWDNGYSDPDLTQDESGRIYSTGINLVNDAVFSSPDGGKTWDKGTIQCHDGDRPWVAGGKAGEVWVAIDPNEGGHYIYQSTDGGMTCGLNGISNPDGFQAGKLLYDHRDGSIIEPVYTGGGPGISILPPGGSAFTEYAPPVDTGTYPHFLSIAIDRADNIYLTWATAGGGCGSSAHGNEVMLAVTPDRGRSWHTYSVAKPGGFVLWPWVAAGADGRAGVAWYQSDSAQDPACHDSNISVGAAVVLDANSDHPRIQTANASGRTTHVGQICENGTDCVATGQDRRLGDYLTDDIDAGGCLVIAAGDTMLKDAVTGSELPTSRPIFMRQSSGPSLFGPGNCT